MQIELGSGGRGPSSPENIKGQLPPRAWLAISFAACQTFQAHPCPPPKSLEYHSKLIQSTYLLSTYYGPALCSSD